MISQTKCFGTFVIKPLQKGKKAYSVATSKFHFQLLYATNSIMPAQPLIGTAAKTVVRGLEIFQNSFLVTILNTILVIYGTTQQGWVRS